jgi:RNA polymerase sigma-70 factor (ECF subfamily)
MESMDELTQDVATCLAGVQRRDEDAARSLVGLLYPLVIKIVRSHLPRRLEEQDLAQMVFARLFAHINQYAGEVPFEHWVSRIAVNTCLNALRAEGCRPEVRWGDMSEEESAVMEKVVFMDHSPDPADRLMIKDLVTQMLGTLPPQDRLLLTLLDMEEHTVDEVHELTGWSRPMIKVRAFRARHKLRKQFSRMSKELGYEK